MLDNVDGVNVMQQLFTKFSEFLLMISINLYETNVITKYKCELEITVLIL